MDTNTTTTTEHDPFDCTDILCPQCEAMRTQLAERKTQTEAQATETVLAVVDPEAAMEYLAELHDAQKALEDEVHMVVGYLKAAGMTWGHIAEGMGMNSKQAAEKRYRKCAPAFRVWRESAADGHHAELERLGRRIGVRAERVRYIVLRNGQEVSRHYYLSRAKLRAGASGEVVRWDPRTGRTTQVH